MLLEFLEPRSSRDCNTPDSFSDIVCLITNNITLPPSSGKIESGKIVSPKYLIPVPFYYNNYTMPKKARAKRSGQII